MMQFPSKTQQLALALPPATYSQTEPIQSQPLCTPVDAPTIPMWGTSVDSAAYGACPSSPIKKPRPQRSPLPSPILDLPASAVVRTSQCSPTSDITNSSLCPPTSSVLQSQLPDMSQDTLALFPGIVAEQAARQNEELQQCSSSQFSAWIAGCAATAASQPVSWSQQTCRPPRHPTSATLPLAKASLLSTLHMHPPLRNPYFASQFPDTTTSAQSGNASHKYSATNASESFDEMEMLTLKDQQKGNPHVPVNQQVASLKACIVASSQPSSSLLHFHQEGKSLTSTFSTVTRATSRIDGILYALKRNIVPFTSASEKLSALQEVFTLAALQNVPNVLRYNTAWWESGGRFLVVQCEWVEGGCVRGRLPVSELLQFGSSIAEVLARMHSLGIVHLDVKPENAFVGDRCGQKAFLLGDFGMSRRVDKQRGTLLYDDTAGFHDARSLDGDARYLCPEAMDTSCAANSSKIGKFKTSRRSNGPMDDSESVLSYNDNDDNFSDSSSILNCRQNDTEAPDVSSTVRATKRRKRFRPAYASDDDTNSSNYIPNDSTTLAGFDDDVNCSSEFDKDTVDEAESPLLKRDHKHKRRSTAHDKYNRTKNQKSAEPLHSRNLMAADVFSLGASLYELATGEQLPSSGDGWHWLRRRQPEVITRMEEATGSLVLARLIGQCLARDPLERPTAASVAAMFADIGPEKSALEKALADVAALKQSNLNLRAALSHIAASGRSKSSRPCRAKRATRATRATRETGAKSASRRCSRN